MTTLGLIGHDNEPDDRTTGLPGDDLFPHPHQPADLGFHRLALGKVYVDLIPVVIAPGAP